MAELDKLRDLTLTSTQEGRPDHLSAGSGLVRRGDYVYVIGDDELDLAIFRLSHAGPGELVPLFEGQLPAAAGERAKEKPDLEALTVIPPFRFNPYGALLALGSGSGETRDRGFMWSLESDGSLRGFPRVVDISPLYGFLGQHVAGELNIEGVAVTEERLALFQRGNSEGGRSQVFYLSLKEVMTSLSSDFSVDAGELDEVQDFDLGETGGVELHFTDADGLADGRLAFAATAEPEERDSPDATKGSVIGVIGPSGHVEQIEAIEPSSVKVEGIDAVLSDRLIHVLLVCDADDVEVPSPLFSTTLPAK
jgi:hypothetical protein